MASPDGCTISQSAPAGIRFARHSPVAVSAIAYEWLVNRLGGRAGVIVGVILAARFLRRIPLVQENEELQTRSLRNRLNVVVECLRINDSSMVMRGRNGGHGVLDAAAAVDIGQLCATLAASALPGSVEGPAKGRRRLPDRPRKSKRSASATA